jgi:hypothetical protein
MSTRIVAPANHSSFGSSNPWQGLELSSGTGSSSKLLQKLGERADKLHEEAAGLAVLRYPPGVSRDTCLAALEQHNSSLGHKEALLVVDAAGQCVQFYGALQGSSKFDLETVGNYDRELAGYLGKMRNFAAGCEVAHLEDLPKLLRLPERGVLLEIGAGSFYQRLKALSNYAQQRRGEFIAHDPAPAAARAAAAELPATPFWALPPTANFLGAALQHSDRPLVVTAKNVLSVMSAERGQDLLAICAAAKPERLVLSQSLQFLVENPSIPEDLRLGPSNMPRLFEDEIFENTELGAVFPKEQNRLACICAATQGYVTYQQALLDVVFRDFLARARELGIFNYGYALATSKTTQVEAQDVAQFFAAHPLRHTAASFRLGHFNTIQIGAFGYNITSKSDVASGNLAVEQYQAHFIYEKEALPRSSALRKIPKSTLVDLSSETSILPEAQKEINPLLLLLELSRGDTEVAVRLAQSAHQPMHQAQKIGAGLGVAHLFRMQDFGVPWFSGNFVTPLREALLKQYGT